MSGHHHGHDTDAGEVRLLSAALLGTLTILGVEVVGGLVAHSLALIADAAHMATDVAAALVALWAAWISRRPRDRKRTYGYGRSKVLGAFVNGAGLFAVTLFLALEAIRRFQEPVAVEPRPMLLIAVLALALNLALSVFLSRSAKRSMNVRAVFVHVLGDALASAGVIVAAIVIALTGWRPADPLASLLIAGLIASSAWPVVRHSANVLMEGVPYDFDLDTMHRMLEAQAGVRGVHDVHAWSVSGGRIATSFHVRIAESDLTSSPQTVLRLKRLLHDRFAVDHATIEVECDDCGDACEPVSREMIASRPTHRRDR